MIRKLCIIWMLCCVSPGGIAQFTGMWDGAGFEIVGRERERIPVMVRMYIGSQMNGHVKGEMLLYRVGYKRDDVPREESLESFTDTFDFEATVDSNTFTITSGSIKSIAGDPPPVNYNCHYFGNWDKDCKTQMRFVFDPLNKLIRMEMSGSRIYPAKLYFQRSEVDLNFLQSYYDSIHQHKSKKFLPGQEELQQKYLAEKYDDRQLFLRRNLLVDKPGAAKLTYFPNDSLMIVQIRNLHPFPLLITPWEYRNLPNNKMYVGSTAFRDFYYRNSGNNTCGIFLELGRIQMTDYAREQKLFPNRYYLETGVYQMDLAHPRLADEEGWVQRMTYQKREIRQ